MQFGIVGGEPIGSALTPAQGFSPVGQPAPAGWGLGCPVCAHFVHYTSRRNRVPPRRGFRVEVQ